MLGLDYWLRNQGAEVKSLGFGRAQLLTPLAAPKRQQLAEAAVRPEKVRYP